MLKKFLNFWNEHSQVVKETPVELQIGFILSYKDLTIGFLTHENGIWKFTYSNEYKKQHEFTPLIDFPDKFKTYTNQALWPFFTSRIPSLNQPLVQETLKKQQTDPNEASLLKLFGKKTIANPFTLESSLP